MFYVENLDPLGSYRLILYSMNAKGRSEPTVIDVIKFKDIAKYTGKYFGKQIIP